MAKKIKRVFADTDTYADPLEDKVDSLEAEGDAISLEDHQKSQDVMVDPEGMISEDMHDSDALVEAAVLLADFDDEDFELGLEDEGEDVSVAVDGAEDEVAEGDEPKADGEAPVKEPKAEGDVPAEGDEPKADDAQKVESEEAPAAEPATDAPVAETVAEDEVSDDEAKELDLESEPDLDEAVEGADEGDDKAADGDEPKAADEAPADDAEKVEAEDTALENAQDPTEFTVDTDMDLVDIDGLDDDMVDDVAFIDYDDDVLAIAANRVIATLTKRAAIKAGLKDIYTQDHFENAVRLEMQKHGLRAGLKNSGFTLASVKVKASKALALAMARAQNELKASAVKTADKQKQVRAQAVAIACMALNRGAFKGMRNTLRDALVAQLRGAGLLNAERVVAEAFKAEGVNFMRNVIKAAELVEEMPEEVRDGFVESLDMTEEPEIEQEVTSDDQFLEDDDMGDESVEGCDMPVQAAVAKPFRQIKANAKENDILAMLKDRKAVMPFGLR